MADYTHLLWIDIETTGTEEGLDCLLEIGCILTTPDLTEIGSMDGVIEPTLEGTVRLQDNDFVREMHERNGLLDDLHTYGGMEPSFCDRTIVAWLEQCGAEPHKVLIAGSGVAHFDRRFIKVQLPRLDRYLAYPALDIGVLRRSFELWNSTSLQQMGYPDVDGKNHRAPADIALHLEEARWFRNLFGSFGAQAGHA